MHSSQIWQGIQSHMERSPETVLTVEHTQMTVLTVAQKTNLIVVISVASASKGRTS